MIQDVSLGEKHGSLEFDISLRLNPNSSLVPLAVASAQLPEKYVADYYESSTGFTAVVKNIIYTTVLNKLGINSSFSKAVIDHILIKDIRLTATSNYHSIDDIISLVIDLFNKYMENEYSIKSSFNMKILYSELDLPNCYSNRQIEERATKRLLPDGRYYAIRNNLDTDLIYKLIFDTAPSYTAQQKSTLLLVNLATLVIVPWYSTIQSSSYTYHRLASYPYIACIPMIQKDRIIDLIDTIVKDKKVENEWFEIFFDQKFFDTFSRYRVVGSFNNIIYKKYFNEGYKITLVDNIFKELFTRDTVKSTKIKKQVDFIQQANALNRAVMYKARHALK